MAERATKPTPVRGGPSKARREEIVATAVKAWDAIMHGDRDRWNYWEEVCPALRLCREDAMRSCGLDPKTDKTPTKNGRYNTVIGRSLKDIGLHGIPKSSRKAGIECAYYLKEIGAWREELRVSVEEKERAQDLNLNHPQVVWRDFAKMQGWNQKEPTEKTFLQLTVKKVLMLDNGQVAQGLASNLTTRRLHAVASAMLERLDVPMRPIMSSALDVPPNSKHEAILAVLDKLGWDYNDRSRLSDALSFGQADREQAEIAALKARVEELEQAAKDAQGGETDARLAEAQDEIGSLKQRISELMQAENRPVSTEWATGDEAAKQIADLTDRLRTAEAAVRRFDDEQFADGADPIAKAAYKDAANKARIARETADQRIRELEAQRDDWRARTHAELEQRYRGRTANAERERDDAAKARDAAVLELRAAERQIAAMKEPLTLEQFTEAEKRQHDEAIQKLAELREKHAM